MRLLFLSWLSGFHMIYMWDVWFLLTIFTHIYLRVLYLFQSDFNSWVLMPVRLESKHNFFNRNSRSCKSEIESVYMLAENFTHIFMSNQWVWCKLFSASFYETTCSFLIKWFSYDLYVRCLIFAYIILLTYTWECYTYFRVISIVEC
jgi:hypothetical protein